MTEKQLKKVYSGEKFDYLVTGLKCHMGFDYVENDTFEEFYLKLKRLCDEYNVHLSAITRREDVMTYTEDEKND